MSNSSSESAGGGGQDKLMSAMFASLVMQNTNMALIFLGQAPHPQTGKTELDLEHAKFLIDQLEMLAVKTKGNLEKQEDALLKQSLTHLRLSFVEAVERPPAPAPTASAEENAMDDEPETLLADPPLPSEPAAESDSRKKFSKKY